MADPLDMTLDDLIKRNKKLKGENVNYRSEGSGRGRAYSSGHRPSLPLPDGGRFRAAPHYINLPAIIKKRERPTEGEASDNKAGTKLYVSNLNFGVSHEDIKVLFSDVGELKRYAIHYDRNGRSKGTAEVVYTQHSDALTAIKRYSHVHLDGRPLKLELVGVDVVKSAIPQATDGISIPPLATGGILGYGWALRRNGPKQGRERGQASRGKRDGREEVSAEALDADLEKYRQGATLLSNF